MRKLFILFTFISLTYVGLSAQTKITGNGVVATKQITTSNYDKISLYNALDVEIVNGAEGKITISGDENILSYVEISVKENELIISKRE